MDFNFVFLMVLAFFMPEYFYAQQVKIAEKSYGFIHEDKNQVDFPGDSSRFINLFGKLGKLVKEGEGQINIVHIGGSHIQADMYTHVVRRQMQLNFPGYSGGRGLVFPFKTAGTNNPFNYSVKTRGDWTSCRNIETSANCTLGISGIVVTTTDTNAVITFDFSKESSLDEFNRIRVFCSDGPGSFVPVVKGDEWVANRDSLSGYIEFQSESYQTSLQLAVQKTDTFQYYFSLYGIEVYTDDPGILYHAIGVNGASIPSYLRCSLFTSQLSVINPDLVILSIGTNDANTRYFDPGKYYSDYDSLIPGFMDVGFGIFIKLWED